MSWMSDEQYVLFCDTRDKKRVAASAHKQRTHCGKGGSVKFPCDFMTKKELKSMNGPVEKFNLNKPMSWEEFKALPDDLKITYIKKLRERFNIPNTALAEMFGVHAATLCGYLKCYGLGVGKSAGGSVRKWDKEGFAEWRGIVNETESEVESENAPEVDTPEESSTPCCETNILVPKTGELNFEGDLDDILRTVRMVLQGGKVKISVKWETME